MCAFPPLLEPSHHYFKYCKISALALLKMVMHARSGGNLEVMGLMLGKVDGETMMIMDSFALPVEGTETRVNAQAAAYEYMAAYIENAKQVRRRRKRTAAMVFFCHGGLEKQTTTNMLFLIMVGTTSQNFGHTFSCIVFSPLHCR